MQGELEKALERFTGQQIRIRGASRTDSGTHAKGQVVPCDRHGVVMEQAQVEATAEHDVHEAGGDRSTAESDSGQVTGVAARCDGFKDAVSHDDVTVDGLPVADP